MADFLSQEERSRRMSAISSKGNRTTELRMIELFRDHQITGWRRHQSFPGRPDFVFRKEKVAVFVDGCFWHGCPRCYRPPATRKKFWAQKIEGNRRRDRRVSRQLRAAGWSVIRVWECSLKKHPSVVARRTKRLIDRRRAEPDGRSAGRAP